MAVRRKRKFVVLEGRQMVRGHLCRHGKYGFNGKVGLVFGGGGAVYGWSHIGVVRALEEAGVHADCVAGTGVGAIVGAAYAAGKINVLAAWARQIEWRHVLSFVDTCIPKSGLIDGDKIAEWVHPHIHMENIEELAIPFCAVATDLRSGHEIVLQRGSLIEAVRASVSVPGIFTVARSENALMADGGLVNPLPVSVARRMGADFIVAVDLNSNLRPPSGCRLPKSNGVPPVVCRKPRESTVGAPHPSVRSLKNRMLSLDLPALMQIRSWLVRDSSPDIFEIILRGARIMQAQIAKTNLLADPPELLIQPRLARIGLTEYGRAEDAVEAGYEAASAVLAEWRRKKCGHFHKMHHGVRPE